MKQKLYLDVRSCIEIQQLIQKNNYLIIDCLGSAEVVWKIIQVGTH